MIDTIGIEAPMTKTLFQAVQSDEKTKSDGKKNYPSIWKKVSTPYGIFKLTIEVEKQTMSMELSPTLHLIGHNVFGTNNVELLIIGIIKLIYKRFKLDITKSDKMFYQERGFGITRIDLTASFIVGSQANVVNTMYLLREHLLAHDHHIVVHEGPDGIETIYLGKHSSRSSVKFYNKYLEVLAKNKSHELPYYSELLKYTEELVRFEVTLRSQSLKGLNSSKAWNTAKIREILEDRLNKLGLSGQLLAELPPDVVAGLTGDKGSKYSLWLAGNDLRKHFQPYTFKRDRQFFLEKGIDITRLHADAQDAAWLSNMLSIERMQMTWPKRFVAMGAVYGKK